MNEAVRPGRELSLVARVLRASASYFALVFMLGAVLGSLRTWALAHWPQVPASAAVLCELPLLLLVSWWLARSLVRRHALGFHPVARLAMGGLAFALLLLAELGLGVFVLGRSFSEQLAGYAESSRSLGLLGQMAFGLLPLFARR